MLEVIKRLLTGLTLAFLGYFLITKTAILFNVLFIAVLLASVKEFVGFFKNKFFALLLALIYPTVPFLLIIYLKLFSTKLTVYAFLIVSIHDVASYVFGTLFGKHLIYKVISPGKSWEGFFAGLLSTAISNYFIFNKIDFNVLLISALISISALLGDMFESYLKRRANLKDSGAILPGHGGLLDRFDAILFTIFIILLYKNSLLILLTNFAIC